MTDKKAPAKKTETPKATPAAAAPATAAKTQGSSIEKKLKVTILDADIQKELNKEIQKAVQSARIDGFRPGKVPVSVIQKRYGAALRAEALTSMMQKCFAEAVEKAKLVPVGMPNINMVTDKPGEDVVFEATFDTYPEVKVTGLDKIKVEKVTATVGEAEIKDMFEKMQKQHTDWKPVTRAAKKSDQVIVDFEGSVKGEKFEGGTAHGVSLELGTGQMIPGFEEGIEGMKAGETKDVKVTFPKAYHAKHLAGQPAVFKMTATAVNEAGLPTLDDDFAKKFNVDTLAKLKAEVKQNMERELDFTLKNKLKTLVMDGLLAQNKIEVPKAMISEEIGALRQQMAQNMQQQMGKQQGGNTPNLPDELFTEEATKRVQLGILLRSLIEANNIKPEQKRIDDTILKTSNVVLNLNK
jgi:trigger factor